MSKERYAEHTVAWELPNRDSVTKGNYNLADIETKYLPIQTEVVSDGKDHTIDELKQRIAELEEQLAEKEEFLHNRDKWIAEREKQVNFSREMERIAFKICKDLEDRWQKLKEWIKEQSNPIDNLVISDDETKYLYMSDILDEMQELENGEKK